MIRMPLEDGLFLTAGHGSAVGCGPPLGAYHPPGAYGWYHVGGVSPDGATLASGGSWDHTVRLWDVASGQEQAILQWHTDHITSVAFSPDGTTLASASDDHTVVLWDVASGQEKPILEWHTDGGVESVAFSPDGATLAGGRWKTVRLWDVASGQEKATLQGHTDAVTSVAFSPDGATLASRSRDGTVLMWDMSPYVTPITAVESASPSLPEQTALLANFPNPFNSSTWISYRLADPGPVRLTIYNALGQPVRTLVDQFHVAGEHHVSWDARDRQGTTVGSGIYLTRLKYPTGVQTRRLLLLK